MPTQPNDDELSINDKRRAELAEQVMRGFRSAVNREELPDNVNSRAGAAFVCGHDHGVAAVIGVFLKAQQYARSIYDE